MKIKIMLVDDHAVVLRGLRFFLGTQPDFDIVDEAHNGRDALEQIAASRPDVVLMDLAMPVMDGVEATVAIQQRYPDIKILVLTSFADQDHVLPALRAGAAGYLLKDAGPDQLAEAIRGAYSGNIQLSQEVAGRLLARPPETSTPAARPDDDGKLHRLTAREQEVLALIARGMSNKEIAAALVIAEKTVKTHVSSILGKLELADRTQAALYAVKHRRGGA